MDFTPRMVALLGQIRKQMNGAVLDSLRYYGADYGMNYGVAIHSLRDIARTTGYDNDFARYLYRQQVRELRIIALWIAEPEKNSVADFDFWAEGIVNSEVAEQAAQALFANIEDINPLLEYWRNADNILLPYTAMLAASRSPRTFATTAVEAIGCVVNNFPDNHLAVQGVVALAASLPDAARPQLMLALNDMGNSPTAQSVREELAWQLLPTE